MKCEYYIKNNLCLGCNLAEQNIEADNCIYRDKSGLERCREILERSEQLKI